MQSKNFIVFILLSAFLVAGWFFLQPGIAPPPEKKPDSKQAKKEPKKEPKKKPDKKKPDKNGKPDKKPTPTKPGKETSVKQVLHTLGSDTEKFHLKVVVTTLGGGVRSVTLNKFKQADANGLPTGKPLELVPDDPVQPSFVLFHYPQPEPRKDRSPSDRLGKMAWKIISRNKDGKFGVALTKEGHQRITFQADVSGFDSVTIRKTYELAPAEYHIRLSVELRDGRKSKSKDPKLQDFRYQLAGAHGLPIEGRWYTGTYRTAMVATVDSKGGPERTIEDSARISKRGGGDKVPLEGDDLGGNAIQYAAVATQYFASCIVVDNEEGSHKNVPPSFLQWARPTLESTEMKGKVKRISGDKKYFTLVDKDAVEHDFVRAPNASLDDFEDLNLGREVYVAFRTGEEPFLAIRTHSTDMPHKPFFDDISIRVNTEKLQLRPDEPIVHKYLLYHGPMKVRLLNPVNGDQAISSDLMDRYMDDLHLDTLTDYHSDSWFGRVSRNIRWTWLLIQCTNLMHSLLGLLYSIVPIHGICIVLLTVIVRGLMFPISRKQAYMSMKMQAVAPEMRKINEKYKTDPRAKTQAMMELYRKHGINPLGGCLPLLMQMPVFLGLYYCFQESIFFRLAGFLWIDNLAAPDMLIYWSESIPWISTPDHLGGMGYLGPYFNLLPILAVSLMLVQQKMLTPPPTDENQAFQMKMMKFMMIFVGFMFYKVASGLCIYFIASSLWGVAERKLLPKVKPGTTPAADVNSPKNNISRGKKPTPPKDEGTGPLKKVKAWWQKVLKDARKK